MQHTSRASVDYNNLFLLFIITQQVPELSLLLPIIQLQTQQLPQLCDLSAISFINTLTIRLISSTTPMDYDLDFPSLKNF